MLGSSAADTLVAPEACRGRLVGRAGSDSLGVDGTDPDDGEGDPCASYSAGARLVGGPGNDSLFGGLADDTLVGGPGRDYADGGYAEDTCFAERTFECEHR